MYLPGPFFDAGKDIFGEGFPIFAEVQSGSETFSILARTLRRGAKKRLKGANLVGSRAALSLYIVSSLVALGCAWYVSCVSSMFMS